MKNFYVLLAAVCMLLPATQSNAQWGGRGGYGGGSFNSMHDHAAMMNWLRYQKAKSDGKNLRKWWKGESTIGIISSAPLAYTYRSQYKPFYNSNGVTIPLDGAYDSTISGTLKPLIGIHANGNSNHLLARLSDNSILSFSVGMQFDLLRYESDEFMRSDLIPDDKDELYVFQVGVPITLDYKWGCDVDFDPDIKGCFAVGGGFMPMWYGGVHEQFSDKVYQRMAPYLYASAGFYAWGCWKVRAAFIPGNYPIFSNVASGDAQTTNTFNLQGKSMFMIGISAMTFSQDWGEGYASRGGGFGKGGGGSSSRRKSRRHGGTMRMF